MKASLYLPVIGVFCAGLMDLDDDENMLEVRSDGFGSEWQGSRLLEDYGHNVIANVPLPQQLTGRSK